MPTTLSQIRAWSTDHLVDAATYWNKTADQWEDVFVQMRNQSYAMAWQGAGGDGLRQRTGADLPTVSAKADQLRQAAGIARNGASEISAAQRRVLYAVEDAQNAGFTVGEDFSVTDTRASTTAAEQAARQAQAQAFAGVNVLALQRMLGHTSAKMTLDTYSGLFDDDLYAVATTLHSRYSRQGVLKTCSQGAHEDE